MLATMHPPHDTTTATFDVGRARDLFPSSARAAYFNTASVGLASEALTSACHQFVDGLTGHGIDFDSVEAAAESARTSVARLIGAEPSDVALVPSVSASAGLVASQFGSARTGQNIVIGQREFSSNHLPWRMLAKKGYEIRQVPFRGGGLNASDVAAHVDNGTQLLAFSGVQSSTGHRSDIASFSSIARAHGAIVFVDGAQMVGAIPVVNDLEGIDVLAVPDHKYLLNPARGLGYCYLSPKMQDRFTPTNAGWQAGVIPGESYFGPDVALSTTASRFDNSINWLAAVGNQAALGVFEAFGADSIYQHNLELANLLRESLSEIGREPLSLSESNRANVVSIPCPNGDADELRRALHGCGVECAARDGSLRFSLHLYNNDEDVLRAASALAEM